MTLGKAQEIKGIWQVGRNRHVHWFLPRDKMKTTKPKEKSIFFILVYTQFTDLCSLFSSYSSRMKFWLYRAVISATWEVEAGGP